MLESMLHDIFYWTVAALGAVFGYALKALIEWGRTE